MPDYRCSIHSKLISHKLKGCLAYDCFGAGQKVAQKIYEDQNWKNTPEIANEMFETFLIVQKLHQMLWYLVEAKTLVPDQKLKGLIKCLILENEKMCLLPPKEILNIDIEEYRTTVNDILKQTGKLVYESISIHGNKSINNKPSFDYMGKNFKKVNLDGKDFSMCLLIASNLEGCSLHGTNFLGADLRDANIKNTDLSQSIFLTQGQINSAKGNHNTTLPPMLSRPTTWGKI